MAETVDVQDLLASLDATEQQLAEFQDIVDSPSPTSNPDGIPSSQSANSSNASAPASQSSLRKIDDLLGSLNQKQHEWEQKVLANQTNTSKNGSGSFLPRAPAVDHTKMLGSVAYPVNHRGSIAGAPVGTVKQEVASALQREQQERQRVKDMHQKWQRTKHHHTRWIRRGSEGVRLTEREVSALIDQGADAEEFEGVEEAQHAQPSAVVTSNNLARAPSTKLTTAAPSAVLNEFDSILESAVASGAATTPVQATEQPPTQQQQQPPQQQQQRESTAALADTLAELDKLMDIPEATIPSPQQQQTPVQSPTPTKPVVVVAPKPAVETSNTSSRPSTPVVSAPAATVAPTNVVAPTTTPPVSSSPAPAPVVTPAATSPASVSPPPTSTSPILTSNPIVQPITIPAAVVAAAQAAAPAAVSKPPASPIVEPQRVHSSQRSPGPLPTPEKRFSGSQPPSPPQAAPPTSQNTLSSTSVDDLDDGALDQILGMLEGVRFSNKLPASPIPGASTPPAASSSPQPSRNSGTLVSEQSDEGREMRKSTKVMAVPLRTAARVQTATTRIVISEPPRSSSPAPSPPVAIPGSAAASMAGATAATSPTNASTSPLAASILRAAAAQRAQLDDAIQDELWVFNNKLAPGAMVQQAISQRRNSFNFSHELILPKISIQVVVPRALQTIDLLSCVPSSDSLSAALSFVTDLYRTFDVSIDPGQSIASLKLFLWVEVFQTQNVTVGGHLTDYLFRAGEDDYFLDEKILVKDTPFFNFCSERKFCPTVYFVQRNELDKLNKAIEVVMEAPLLMNDEAGQFRKEMHRILSVVMFKHYRRLPYLTSFEPTATETTSGVWPQAFPVQIFVPEDNNPNSARPPEKRTVAVPFRGTARRVVSSAQSDYPYLFEFKSEAVNDYVVKVRGYNEFFVGDMELIASEYVRDCIRKRKRIDLVVIEKDHLSLDSLALVSHYTELLSQGKKNSTLVEMETLLSRESHPPNLRFSSLSLDRPLKVLLKSLEPIPFDPKLFNAPKKRTDLIQLYASCEVRHVGATIGVVMRSNKQFYYEDAKDPIKFDSMLDMPSYAVLPRASILHFEIHALYRDKDTLLGWTEYQLFDSRGVISPGTFSSGLWLLAVEGQAAQQPISGSSLLEKSTGPKLSFVIEDLGKPVVFPEFDYAEWKAENPNQPLEESPPVPVLTKLREIISKDALQVLDKDEKALLWQHRGWCKAQPAAAAKLLQSVPWVRPGSARELYRLLHEWAPLPPMAAIELLNKNFIDPEIRAFAVKNLHRLSDDELADILLQLVQALKHELDHDSFLARFLIIRAIYNPLKLGNYFFWHLKASLLQTAYRERFEVVLEVYLRYCGSFRQNLGAQLQLFRKIHSAAVELKTLKEPRRKPFLDDKLEHLGVETPFQIPISCTLLAKGFRIEKCKNLDSKTLPLWLVCENMDNLGDSLTFIMKAGDDLRQDQLTVQMFRIMDRLWLAAGLDLKMSPYVVLDAGAETGMIEVVPHAATSAAIQKEYGGVKAAFSEKPLLEWLKKHNPNDADLRHAIRDFTRSCAGYCVATYVLGIGDRHNDNVMCTKSGLLFHIDFGRFLGNTEKFAGVSRDRAPFVFTPEFLYAMGGANSEQYKHFVDLCCKAYNVLRAHANIFINLFAMMLSTGIPELREEGDINYLRDAFSLGLTDEQAAKKMESLITESLKSKATQLNNAIHIFAHPDKDS